MPEKVGTVLYHYQKAKQGVIYWYIISNICLLKACYKVQGYPKFSVTGELANSTSPFHILPNSIQRPNSHSAILSWK